jgi:hypothetical protein
MTNGGHPKSRAAFAAAKLFTAGPAGNPLRPTAPTVNNFG